MNKNKLKMKRKTLKKMTNEDLTLLLLDMIKIHNKFVDETVTNINILEERIENKCVCITDIRFSK